MGDDGAGALDVRAMNALRESVGGDQEFLAELINEFLDDVPRQLASLRAAGATGDSEEARRAAHTLKSHGATFGVPRIEIASRSLETEARDGRFTDIDALTSEIESSLDEVTPLLRALAADGPAA